MTDQQPKHYCPNCGAAITKYKVTATKSLADMLIKFRRLEIALGKREIWVGHDDKGSEYQLSLNDHRNMSRLRFLGLARYTESHSARWFITRRGYAFLRGEAIPKEVWIYRNKILDSDRTDATVTLADVFRKVDAPYFEPVTDQQYANVTDRGVAVERLEKMGADFSDTPIDPSKLEQAGLDLGVEPIVQPRRLI